MLFLATCMDVDIILKNDDHHNWESINEISKPPYDLVYNSPHEILIGVVIRVLVKDEPLRQHSPGNRSDDVDQNKAHDKGSDL